MPDAADRLEAVVFDVDGTLVDSERDGHRVAFNRAFEEFGLSDSWGVELYGELLETTGGERRIKAYFESRGRLDAECEELAARLHARKTEIFIDMAKGGEIAARPGVGGLLDELEAAGVRLAVATTGTRGWVDALLDRLFSLERFEVVVGGDDAPQRKPDPSAYVMVLERMRIEAPVAVALEDSLNGLRAAKGAGLPCAVVINDYTRDQDFAAADLVLDAFGGPEALAGVLADPHGLAPPGRLDVGTLRRLAASAA